MKQQIVMTMPFLNVKKLMVMTTNVCYALLTMTVMTPLIIPVIQLIILVGLPLTLENVLKIVNVLLIRPKLNVKLIQLPPLIIYVLLV